MIKRWWFLLPLVAVGAWMSSGVFTFNEMMTRLSQSWERLAVVEVYLRDDITIEQKAALQSQIAAIPQVGSYFYVSRELPASFRIRLKNFSTAEEVSAQLTQRPGVAEVIFPGPDARKAQILTMWLQRAVTAGVVVAEALLLVSAVAIRSVNRPKYA